MRILVTNDDGVYADGLWALVRELSKVGEVTVVAPDREQSGSGTAVSLSKPLRASKIRAPVEGISAYAVEGTPGDATILALHALIEEPVDAVVSGINLGSNVGNDTLISGTVGAALQGYSNGVFSLAVSLGTMIDPNFDTAARLAAIFVESRARGELEGELFLNLNLPHLPLEEIQGLGVFPLGGDSYLDTVEEQIDRRGRQLFHINRGTAAPDPAEGTDVWAVRQGYAVLTPLRPGPFGDEPWSELNGLAKRLWRRLIEKPQSAAG